jgi:hypothetical protein
MLDVSVFFFSFFSPLVFDREMLELWCTSLQFRWIGDFRFSEIKAHRDFVYVKAKGKKNLSVTLTLCKRV